MVAASGLLFALAGVAIRLASAGLSSVEVLFWRNVLSLLILTPWIIVRWPDSIRPVHTGLIVMRGVAVVVSLLCYYYAVSVIPLGGGGVAQLQRPDFRFALNRAVLIAVVMGFAGTALILKPGTALFEPAALIGLAAGVLGALAVVAVWRMPKQESAARIAVYFALIGIAITAGPVLVEPRLPPAETWPALAILGVCSTAAHVLFARGCLIAPADRVGTLHYTAVLFAAGLAWLIWDERVDWFMAAGTLLIVVASVIAVRAGPMAARGLGRQLHGRRSESEPR